MNPDEWTVSSIDRVNARAPLTFFKHCSLAEGFLRRRIALSFHDGRFAAATCSQGGTLGIDACMGILQESATISRSSEGMFCLLKRRQQERLATRLARARTSSAFVRFRVLSARIARVAARSILLAQTTGTITHLRIPAFSEAAARQESKGNDDETCGGCDPVDRRAGVSESGGVGL